MRENAQRPTIIDVAREAGVSFSTASLALRQPNRVSPKTRERVIRAVDALGYRLNHSASTMASSENTVGPGEPLAFITWETNPHAQQRPTLYEADIRYWANQRGYTIERYELSLEKKPARLFDILHARGVTGLIIGPVYNWVEVDLSRFAVVRCHQYSYPEGYALVRHAVFEETVNAFTRMRQLGYKAIAPIIYQHNPRHTDDYARRGAILACQQDLSKDERAIPSLETVHGTTCDFNAWIRWHKPDAVLGFSIADYYNVIECGLRIPQDIGFATLHLESDSTAISGIKNDHQIIARNAIQFMDALLRFREYGKPIHARQLNVPFMWVDADSLPAKQIGCASTSS